MTPLPGKAECLSIRGHIAGVELELEHFDGRDLKTKITAYRQNTRVPEIRKKSWHSTFNHLSNFYITCGLVPDSQRPSRNKHTQTLTSHFYVIPEIDGVTLE